MHSFLGQTKGTLWGNDFQLFTSRPLVCPISSSSFPVFEVKSLSDCFFFSFPHLPLVWLGNIILWSLQRCQKRRSSLGSIQTQTITCLPYAVDLTSERNSNLNFVILIHTTAKKEFTLETREQVACELEQKYLVAIAKGGVAIVHLPGEYRTLYPKVGSFFLPDAP